MLVDKEVTRHRSCYSHATNQTELQRARDRFEQSVATGQYAMFDKSAAFYASWITGKLSSELEL